MKKLLDTHLHKATINMLEIARDKRRNHGCRNDLDFWRAIDSGANALILNASSELWVAFDIILKQAHKSRIATWTNPARAL